MTGLRCDISAEVDGCARRLKEYFERVGRDAVGRSSMPVVDVCEIQDILKDALPLGELFSLRESVRAACGADRIPEFERAVEEQAAKVAGMEDR